MNNNLALITQLVPRLCSVAAHCIADLERKGYKPFILVPETKEDTKATSFELRFRGNNGKPFDKPELVEASIKKFRQKEWGVRRSMSKVFIDSDEHAESDPQDVEDENEPDQE